MQTLRIFHTNHIRATRVRGNKKLQSTNCYVHVSSNQDKHNSTADRVVIRVSSV